MFSKLNNTEEQNMDYGSVFIGIRTTSGKSIDYRCDYDNEIVPRLKLADNWKELFEDVETRETMLSESFDASNRRVKNLKSAATAFDAPRYGIRTKSAYNKFMKEVKEIDASDISLIALGVAHGGNGYYSHDWIVLDVQGEAASMKSWKDYYGAYTGPNMSCIEEAISREGMVLPFKKNNENTHGIPEGQSLEEYVVYPDSLDFKGKTIVFDGHATLFKCGDRWYSHKELLELNWDKDIETFLVPNDPEHPLNKRITRLGGVVRREVSGKTDFFVLNSIDEPPHMQKFFDQKMKGKPVMILTYQKFMELLETAEEE